MICGKATNVGEHRFKCMHFMFIVNNKDLIAGERKPAWME